MSNAPSNLREIPWLAAGANELGVARFGSVGAHGHYEPSYDSAHHIRNNPRILQYFKATSFDTKSESTSWCSAFVNWCMLQAGIMGTRSAEARSWRTWQNGVKLEGPAIGAVVVFPRPPSVRNGHVAMVWSVGDGDAIEVLGGNQGGHAANVAKHITAQSSRVSIAHRRRSEALDFFWPKNFTSPGNIRRN